MNEFTIRSATSADLDLILNHRQRMFSDMGYRDEGAITAMLATSRPFFAERLANGRYRGWLVENPAGLVVAGGGVFVFDHQSSPRDPSPRRAVIVNMYTEPVYRRRGLARTLMETMIDWCRREGFGTVSLHASSDGRALYERLGFAPTNELRLTLR